MKWVSANGVNFLSQLYAIPMPLNDLNGQENMSILPLKTGPEFVGQMNALLSMELGLKLFGLLIDHQNNLRFMISMRSLMGKV